MPALFLLIPLLGVIIINLPGRKIGNRMAVWAALAVAIIQIGMAVTSGSMVWQGLAQVVSLPFGASLQIDLFTAVVLATTGLIAAMSLILDKNAENPRSLYFGSLVLVTMMGMNGVVMVRDIFSLYVFLEITAVASFVLISINKERDPLEGAFKYFVMSAVATVLILAAIAILLLTVGSVGFKAVADNLSAGGVSPQVIVALILFIAGLSIKAGLIPFHAWLPDAYSSAPPAVSMLLAGIITKVTGVYTIMRLITDVFSISSIMKTAFMVLGAVSIVIGALAAMRQDDFKRMLAYSSISQVGYIILSAGLGTPLGFAAALLHFFNHATFKSLLFVNAAAVESRSGTRQMSRLGGLASKMPITGGTSVVGFLSTAGVPPLSGFWSKLLIVIALWQAGAYFYAVVAVLASILTLAYFLIMQRRVFFGKLREGLESIREAGAAAVVPSLILAGITVLVGLLFPLVLLLMQSQGLI
ncbi:MAG: proton-conducting transporter membrane subunit [Bacillota bacterium]|nr:proton-conducting transporter membrane subunit [Bacillota bacterium]